MEELTSDRWGIWTTILENLTWNGHKDSVIWEWVAKDGAGDRHYNAHNAFFGVAYNNGFIAGLLLVAYTALAFIRALRYYWAHRKERPSAVLHGVHSGGHVRIGLRAVLGDRLRVFSGSGAALARGISPPRFALHKGECP